MPAGASAVARRIGCQAESLQQRPTYNEFVIWIATGLSTTAPSTVTASTCRGWLLRRRHILCTLAGMGGGKTDGTVAGVRLRREQSRTERHLDTVSEAIAIVVQHLPPVAKADNYQTNRRMCA